MDSKWRMRCYYCTKYEKGTCPYEKRRTVPKKCRRFEHPSMYVPRVFSGFEIVVVVIVMLIAIISTILLIGSLLLAPLI